MIPRLLAAPLWFKNFLLIVLMSLLVGVSPHLVGKLFTPSASATSEQRDILLQLEKHDGRIDGHESRLATVEEALKALPRMERNLERLTQHLLNRAR